MTVEHAADDHTRRSGDLDRLISRERIHGRYALFFVTGEGVLLPDGTEEESGYVIDEFGRVFSFWTGWDDERGEVVFSEWEPVNPEPHWSRSAEYRSARRSVGLSDL